MSNLPTMHPKPRLIPQNINHAPKYLPSILSILHHKLYQSLQGLYFKCLIFSAKKAICEQRQSTAPTNPQANTRNTTQQPYP